MSTRSLRLSNASLLVPAVFAGIIGGIIVDAYLILSGQAPFPTIWQFVASTLVGKVAYTSPAYIALGLAMHFAISIFWAVLYLYVWRALNTPNNWVLGAVALGIAADIGMSILLAATGNARPLGVVPIVMGLITHIVFFALPVTWYLSRNAQRSA